MSRLALAALASAALLSACAPMPPPAPRPSPPPRRRPRRPRPDPATGCSPTTSWWSRAFRRCRRASPGGRALHRLPRPRLRRLAPDAARDAGLASQGRRRHDADLPPRRADGRARAADRLRRAGLPGELRAADRRLHRLRAQHRRRRGGAALPPRPGDPADDAPSPSPDERHDMQGWLHPQQPAALPPRCRWTAPRAAAGATRSRRRSDAGRPDAARRRAPARRAARRRLGRRRRSSWDDRRLALTPLPARPAESEVWLLDLASGERSARSCRRRAAATRRRHFAAAWKRDSSGFFFVSDRGGEFRELMFYSPRRRPRSRRSRRHITWDIDGRQPRRQTAACSPCAPTSRAATNCASSTPTPSTSCRRRALPEGSVADGAASIRACRCSRSRSTAARARARSARSTPPTAAAALDPPYAPPGVDTGALRRAADRPLEELRRARDHRHRRARRRRASPAGGRCWSTSTAAPRARPQFGFLGRYNYFIEELGIAVIQPNVRGSSGFGKTFLSLDDGMKREDSVKDIGALLDWIATQPRPRPGARGRRRAAATAAT